jgi:beta-ribofuranosylaminobenzene 5'-phosphate synthase
LNNKFFNQKNNCLTSDGCKRPGEFVPMEMEDHTIRVRTPARLHFTLIDLNGELGRIDGGIGVAIDKPNWDIHISKSTKWIFPEDIADVMTRIQNKMNLSNCYKINIESQLPIHVGLGSQTQMALAIAQGISILEGRSDSIYELASIVGRGGTSGIGIAAYEHGGFIMDGGHTCDEKPKFLPSHFSNAKPAMLVNRFEIPHDWYFVVVVPNTEQGKHGKEESEIFEQNCPVPADEVEKVSRIILMQILPSIIDRDINRFGSGLSRIQEIGFKRVENELQTDFVRGIQQFLIDHGAAGTGLSSFGPATFGVVDSEDAAKRLATQTEEYLKLHDHSGYVFFTRVNNKGAELIRI